MKTMNRAEMKWEDKDGLKSCPHCGREAAFRRVAPTLNDGAHPLAGAEYIECTNRQCGASTVAMFSMMDDCKPMLAERWNRRAVT